MNKIWIGGFILAALVGVLVYMWAKKSDKPRPEAWAAGSVAITLLLTWVVNYFNNKRNENKR